MFPKCSAQRTFSAFLGARMSCHPGSANQDSSGKIDSGKEISIADCTSTLKAGSHYHYLHGKTPGFFHAEVLALARALGSGALCF